MGGAGFEPAKAMPPDLQSGPFGRLGIHPFQSAPEPASQEKPRQERLLDSLSSRAGGETRTHNPRFTKPKLCQLSYTSNLNREIVDYIRATPRCKAFSPQR
jgi:hypothetical protein